MRHAGLAFIVALAGPALLTGCAQLSVAPTSASPSPTASATTTSPSPTATVPAKVWVNAPLGGNLRADHAGGAAVVGLLRQGAELTVAGSWPEGKPEWYKVSAADLSGWISAKVVVAVHILRTGSTDLVAMALPDGLYGTQTPGNANDFTVRTGPQPSDPVFLRVRRAAKDADLPVDSPGVLQRSAVVEVWSFTGLQEVYQRPDGTAYHVVRVPGGSGRYLIEFFDRGGDPTRVQQILDSLTLF